MFHQGMGWGGGCRNFRINTNVFTDEEEEEEEEDEEVETHLSAAELLRQHAGKFRYIIYLVNQETRGRRCNVPPAPPSQWPCIHGWGLFIYLIVWSDEVS